MNKVYVIYCTKDSDNISFDTVGCKYLCHKTNNSPAIFTDEKLANNLRDKYTKYEQHGLKYFVEEVDLNE